jgi:hypothetical protein
MSVVGAIVSYIKKGKLCTTKMKLLKWLAKKNVRLRLSGIHNLRVKGFTPISPLT